MNIAMNALVSWRTTLTGLSPLLLYVLQWAGYWPAWAPPLPPLADVWPTIIASAGLGISAKDAAVSGTKTNQ